MKVFRLGKKVLNKCRPLLVQFEKENAKAKIPGKSYLLKSTELYSNIYVSVEMIKSERMKHKQLNSNQGELVVKPIFLFMVTV